MNSQHIPELEDAFNDFLRRYYHEDVLELANKYPREQKSLWVDFTDIVRFDNALADDYISQPGVMIDHIERALAEYDLPADISLSNANVRVENLPEHQVRHIGEYRPEEINNLVSVKGQVKLLSEPKVDVSEAVFQCQLCGTNHRIPQGSSANDYQEPHACEGCERQGPFKFMKEQSTFEQYQLARLTRPPEHARGDGADIDVVIRDDLAGEALEGNERILANGVLTVDEHSDNGPPFPYMLTVDGGGFDVLDGGYEDVDIEKFLDEIHEIADSDDPIQLLLDSLAPQLSRDEDLENIMTAIVLQLVSAGKKDTDAGPSFRGDFHILILSDPGMGKSELLNRVRDIAPVGRIASGKGLSKAGVTAAAVREKDFAGDQWVLKAGLLVLANDGMACLDEIDKVNPEAISAMHRALESQKVSVMKAGIDSELPARCSLLAAGNPKHGRFDAMQPISEQIDLEPSLMSRFDLMFMMNDVPDTERDRELGEHVVGMWMDAADHAYEGEPLSDDVAGPIPDEVFRSYIAYARERVHPRFEDKSLAMEIVNKYVDVRSKGADEDSPVPVTARKLEAFLRLAEASARARLSDTIEREDVERAIELVMKSLNDVGIDPETGEFDVDIVESGTSKSQRDRIKGVKSVIQDVEEEFKHGAPIDEVLELCDVIGIDPEKAEKEIEKLKTKGEVYEPTTDHLRTS